VGVVRQLLDGRGEDVKDAVVGVGVEGDADVARQDAYAHVLPQGHAAVAHPQAAAGEGDARQVPLGIEFGDLPFQHDTGVFAQTNGQVDPRQNFAHGAAGERATLFQYYQVIRQACDFVGGVADV